ncbi:hypothetical protein [Liquorilactobacillus aquaticus]|nr:hypothetical protein [Liquorilactobacillus aquaticus]
MLDWRYFFAENLENKPWFKQQSNYHHPALLETDIMNMGNTFDRTS